jgi:hypothetical protein
MLPSCPTAALSCVAAVGSKQRLALKLAFTSLVEANMLNKI